MIVSDKKKSQFIYKLSMAVLAALPLLAWYKIPFPVGLGYALILLLGTIEILNNHFRINVLPLTFWLVFAYVCFMWMYNYDFSFWTLFPPGGWMFFIFTLALIWGVVTFDLNLFKKYMRWIVIISGALFWIQFVMFVSTGSSHFCFVPNLTGAFTYEDFSYADVVRRHLSGQLPSSIFLEKSYLAYYFLTYLSLIWFETNDKIKIFSKEIIFVIATLIASRSGTALIGFSILLSAKAFSMFWTANIGRRILLIILLIPMIIGAIYLYVDSELGQQMINRSTELSNEGTSGYSRVVGGYMMFDQLSPEEKIVGIPDARERFGFIASGGTFVFFANGIQTILLNLGYIGALVYLLFYVNIFRKVSITSRMSIIVLLIMSLLESNYLNPYMMLLTIIPCAEYHNKKTISRLCS